MYSAYFFLEGINMDTATSFLDVAAPDAKISLLLKRDDFYLYNIKYDGFVDLLIIEGTFKTRLINSREKALKRFNEFFGGKEDDSNDVDIS